MIDFSVRSYFRRHLEHIVIAELERTTTRHDTILSQEIAPALRSVTEKILHLKRGKNASKADPSNPMQLKTTSRDSATKVRPDMIRRVDMAPRLIDPMGRCATAQDGQPASPRAETSFASGISTMQVRDRRTSTTRTVPEIERDNDFGGFPYPQDLISRALRRTFPSLHHRLSRTMTMPRTETLVPSTTQTRVNDPAKHVPYISFRVTVGRNSAFKGLTAENIEELGGVEYRALSALLWIVPVASAPVFCLLEVYS